MPIVGPAPATPMTFVVSVITVVPVNPISTVPGCITTVTGGKEWWHSTVFVTSPIELISFNVPELITVYKYPADCTNRWMLAPSSRCVISGQPSGYATVFSIDPGRGVVSDPL